MLEVGKLTSYLGGKFLLSNIKKEKQDILLLLLRVRGSRVT